MIKDGVETWAKTYGEVECPNCGGELADVAPSLQISGRRDTISMAHDSTIFATCRRGHQMFIRWLRGEVPAFDRTTIHEYVP